MITRFFGFALGFVGSLAAFGQTGEQGQSLTTPAALFDKFASEHRTDEAFTRGLEEKLVAKFSAVLSDVDLLVFCRRIEGSGTFGLVHPAIQSLGLACQGQDKALLRKAYGHFASTRSVEEFRASLSSQIQTQGGLQNFSRNLSRTLVGSEHPILAFGIYALFGT